MPLTARQLQQIVLLGDHAEFILSTGTSIDGKVIAISEESITLENSVLIAIDSISMARKIEPNDKQDSVESKTPLLLSSGREDAANESGFANAAQVSFHPLEGDPLQGLSRSDSLKSSPVFLDSNERSTSELAHLKRVMEVNVKLSVLSAETTLSFPEDPPSRSQDSLSGQSHTQNARQWEDLWRSYEYAKRKDELHPKYHRVKEIAAKAEKLWHSGRNDLFYLGNLAFYQLLAHKYEDAEKNLLALITDSQTQKYWYNLAYVYACRERNLEALWALQEYFRTIGPAGDMDAWYVYLGLIVKNDAWVSLVHLSVNTVIKQESKSHFEDALIFVLAQKGCPGLAERYSVKLSGENDLLSVVKEGLTELNAGNIRFTELLETQARLLQQTEKPLSHRDDIVVGSQYSISNVDTCGRMAGHIYIVYGDSRQFGFVRGIDNQVEYHFYYSDIAEQELSEKVQELPESTMCHIPVSFIPWANEKGAKASALESLGSSLGNSLLDIGMPHTSASGLVGRIESFGNKGFGFLTDETRISHFFSKMDVEDDRLREVLEQGNWRHVEKVFFDRVPAPGHRYPRAVSIILVSSTETLLEQARQLQATNRTSEAIGLVKRVLVLEPQNSLAAELEAQMQLSLRDKGVGLPPGSGQYARAKRAQLQDGDYPLAERLFREAIERGDRGDSAAKDLASLLQHIGRADEAVTLLEEQCLRRKFDKSFQNMLGTFYQHAAMHDKAIGVLQAQIKAAKSTEKPKLLRRLAVSQFKLQSYDEAEKTLKLILIDRPNDAIAQRWLIELEDARKSGEFEEVHSLFEGLSALPEEGIVISAIARDALDRCEFKGTDPKRRQKGAFTRADVEYVENLAKEFSTRKPGDRAEYYLSAAAIVYGSNVDLTTAHAYAYLGRYFVSRADSAWLDRKPADLVRSLYLESLSLAGAGEGAWRTLLRFLCTFVASDYGEMEKMTKGAENSAALSEFLVAHGEQANLGARLLRAAVASEFVTKAVIECIRAYEPSREFIVKQLGLETTEGPISVEAAWKERVMKSSKDVQRRSSLFRAMTKHRLSVTSIDDMQRQIEGRPPDEMWDLDERRLAKFLDLLRLVVNFCRSADFEDREHHYRLLEVDVGNLLSEIEGAPTHFTFESLHPLAKHVFSLVQEDFAQIEASSGADIMLELLSDSYTPDTNGVIKLQVQISNRYECSPASDVLLASSPRESEYFARIENEYSLPTLRGGAKADLHLLVKPTTDALSALAFPIALRVKYKNRSGEICHTEVREFTVRLYNIDEFKPIDPNPYAPYSQGGPVESAEMFYGREQDLKRVEDALLAPRSTRKCITLFGQKRAGKSSMLLHLKRRLMEKHNCIVIHCEFLGLREKTAELDMFLRLLFHARDAVESFALEHGLPVSLRVPTPDELERNPPLIFQQSIRSFVRELSSFTSERSIRIVLLIDEFTEIFKLIKKARIEREFMKSWKAIVEGGLFSTVLVGQDIMPAFEDEFPNEFGIAEDIRVTYLRPSAAKQMIVEPIGLDRYKGSAIAKILELTAGSPYYTMLFCRRLVDYINDTRSLVVTEADITQVKITLLHGAGRLQRKEFDGLLTGGDGKDDTGIDPEDTLSLCRDIAVGGAGGWCARSKLSEAYPGRLGILLQDLERRDVVERKDDTFRIQVGLFREWLCLQG